MIDADICERLHQLFVTHVPWFIQLSDELFRQSHDRAAQPLRDRLDDQLTGQLSDQLSQALDE